MELDLTDDDFSKLESLHYRNEAIQRLSEMLSAAHPVRIQLESMRTETNREAVDAFASVARSFGLRTDGSDRLRLDFTDKKAFVVASSS